MRREKNQYIFASEMTRGQGHKVRNSILLILPILIVAVWVLNITVSRRVTLDEIRLTVLNLPDDIESYSTAPGTGKSRRHLQPHWGQPGTPAW